MRYKRGDELHLRIDDHGIPRSVKVQVIGFNVDCEGPEAEYLVYVPAYVTVQGTFELTVNHANWWGVHPKFVGDQVKFIEARHPIYQHVPAAEGESCDRCGDFVEHAARDSDGAYACRACQLNPYR